MQWNILMSPLNGTIFSYIRKKLRYKHFSYFGCVKTIYGHWMPIKWNFDKKKRLPLPESRMHWSLFWRRLLFTSSVLCHQKRLNLQIWVGVPTALSRIKWLNQNHRGFRAFLLKCAIHSRTMNRKIIILNLYEKLSQTKEDQ